MLATRVGDGLLPLRASSLARHPTNGRLWLADVDGDRILEIDGATGDREEVVGAGATPASTLTAPSTIRWRTATSRLVVSTSPPATFVSINPSSFSKTQLWDGRIGGGANQDMLDFGLRDDGTALGGAGLTGDLVAVDLAAGSASSIAITDAGGFVIGDLRGWAVDDVAGIAFASDPTQYAIAAIDLLTGVTTALASDLAGVGPLIGATGIALSLDRTLPYASGRGATGALLGINVATGARTELSPASAAVGPLAGECTGFALSPEGGCLWGTAQGRAVVLFDLATGERVLVSR